VRLLRQAPGGAPGGFPLARGGAAVATVAVDGLGADRGIAEVAAGAREAARAGTRCILFGPARDLREALAGTQVEALAVEDAPEEITNREEPVRAVRSKPDASVVLAARAVAESRADALVSAGPTGAVLAATVLHVRRIAGVYRPAVAAVLPLPRGQLVLLDVGANVDVRPEHLVQFAYMGAAFSERVLGVERPRVGLLSVGEEGEKGTEDVVTAHRGLERGNLNFAGNVEGDGVTAGQFDVVVTDGFTGNVALKLMEGTSRTLIGAIAEAARSGPLAMLGGLALRPKLRGLREQLDPERAGGAYLLGLRRPVVICHGRSSRRAIENAIALAARGVEESVVERTAEALAEGGALRGEQEAVSVGADSFTAP
jgi:glycerol-3-phosphate acyltransferase PlsX